MRLVVVHPRMSVLGGAERVAIHSLKAGLEAGYEVALISEEFDPRRIENFFACEGLFERVETLAYPIFKPKLMRRALLYRQLYYHRRQIQRVLAKHPDIHLLLSTQDIGYVPDTSARVVQYCYFPDYFSHIEFGRSVLGWRLYYWPARRYYHERAKHVDGILSTSNYTRDVVKRVWERDSLIIYPPCPVNLYESKEQPKENLVITVGRIVPEKRIEVFLDIARELPSLAFVAIGRTQEGKETYFEHLLKQKPNNASIIDLPLREASDILARAKVYVHCTHSEQFGISIVEAMAAGCVPVVHDSGGPREIVTPEVGFRWLQVDEAVKRIAALM
ncbi:glycosyltransferase, partial [Candidatus Bathyarchaeota archaeon]|nr:glycosyltransferase [Candidatus Bathyarchaeota archaeon]